MYYVCANSSSHQKWPRQYKIGLVVGSDQPDEFVGVVSPILWEKYHHIQDFSAQSVYDRNIQSANLATSIGQSLGLVVERSFFVREAFDKSNQRRAIVCVVAESVVPLGKKLTLLPKAKCALLDTPECRQILMDALARILRGQPPPK